MQITPDTAVKAAEFLRRRAYKHASAAWKAWKRCRKVLAESTADAFVAGYYLHPNANLQFERLAELEALTEKTMEHAKVANDAAYETRKAAENAEGAAREKDAPKTYESARIAAKHCEQAKDAREHAEDCEAMLTARTTPRRV